MKFHIKIINYHNRIGSILILLILCLFTGCKPKPYDDSGDWDFNSQYDKEKAAKVLEEQKAPKGTPMSIVLDSVSVVEPRISRMIKNNVLSFFENEGLDIDDHVLTLVTSKGEGGEIVFLRVQNRKDLFLHDVIGYFKIENLVCIAEGEGDGYPFPKIKTKSLKLHYRAPSKFSYSEKNIADWGYIFTKDSIYYCPDID
ncbi:MAG: hypothetical protein LIP09_08290 [Bacteroidales bacterium]|nr:hypothetical protein [Bacteroidales bacterium]